MFSRHFFISVFCSFIFISVSNACDGDFGSDIDHQLSHKMIKLDFKRNLWLPKEQASTVTIGFKVPADFLNANYRIETTKNIKLVDNTAFKGVINNSTGEISLDVIPHGKGFHVITFSIVVNANRQLYYQRQNMIVNI